MSSNEPDPFRKPTYLGLFQLCAQASTGTPEESGEPAEPLEQRRQWLENVLDNMSDNIPHIMMSLLDVIKEDLPLAICEEAIAEFSSESLVFCLDSLMQYTDSMDNAIDFHKIGGFSLLEDLLTVPSPTVKAKTAELIADLVQNNRYCQEKALEIGLLPDLFQLLDSDTDETVCVKALYAISCLCRQNPLISSHLKNVDGLSVLLRAIQKPIEKLRIKVAFLLTHLIDQLPEIRDTLYNMGFIQLLISLFKCCDYESCNEHLLSALLALASNHEPSRLECSSETYQLSDYLLQKMKVFENGEQEESLYYCIRLFSLIAPDDDSADIKESEELER